MSRFLLVKSKSWIAQALLYSLSSTFCHATCSIVLHSFLPICFRNVYNLAPFTQAIMVDVPIMIKSRYHSFLENFTWFTSILFHGISKVFYMGLCISFFEFTVSLVNANKCLPYPCCLCNESTRNIFGSATWAGSLPVLFNFFPLLSTGHSFVFLFSFWFQYCDAMLHDC